MTPTPTDHARRIEYWPLADIKPDEKNPKAHSIETIDQSIGRFGVIDAIVVDGRTGKIISGHGRREALMQMKERGESPPEGVQESPEGDWLVPVAAGWSSRTDSEASAALIALNRTTELGGWVDEELLSLLDDLSDLGEEGLLGVGFYEEEMEELRKNLEEMSEDQGPGGVDESGDEDVNIKPPAPSLMDRFLEPPFSILDGRSGRWQERKNRWKSLGIQSELGRGDDLVYDSPQTTYRNWYEVKNIAEVEQGKRLTDAEMIERYGSRLLRYTESGASIFDPVVCELTYRWFSGPGDRVLDPFAGGSVRGLIASLLGRKYHGIELRSEQVEANYKQSELLLPRADAETVSVRVSAAMLRQEFHGCEPDYIRDVCHGRCCRSESSATGNGILVTIHPSEEAAIEASGGVVVDGLLQPTEGERKCPFQHDEGLCGLHGSEAKPFGCIASPFTLNKNGTLIVRNRYRTLSCFKDLREDGTQLPAYIAFRASLDLIFGQEKAQEISDHLEQGGGDLIMEMPQESYRKLVDNDAIKASVKGQESVPVGVDMSPEWVIGDSLEVLPTLEDESFDLIFSCPPYADLEVYSDDPADISNMPYEEFLEAYRGIISAAASKLSNNRFAVWVVGEVRDSKGNYRGLVPDTVRAFQDAGMHLYNEAILLTSIGSAAFSAAGAFEGSRKLKKSHQQVLVFVKGDAKIATANCGPVTVSWPDEGGEEDADANE